MYFIHYTPKDTTLDIPRQTFQTISYSFWEIDHTERVSLSYILYRYLL